MFTLSGLVLLSAIILASTSESQPSDEATINESFIKYCRGIEKMREAADVGGEGVLQKIEEIERRELLPALGYLGPEFDKLYENPQEEADKKCADDPAMYDNPLCRYFFYVEISNSMNRLKNFPNEEPSIYRDYIDIVILHPYVRLCEREFRRNIREPKAKQGIAMAVADGNKEKVDALNGLYSAKNNENSIIATEIKRLCNLKNINTDEIFCLALPELSRLIKLTKRAFDMKNEKRSKKRKQALKLHYMILKYNFIEEFPDMQPKDPIEINRDVLKMLKAIFKIVITGKKIKSYMSWSPKLESLPGCSTGWRLPARAKKNICILLKVIIGIHVFLKKTSSQRGVQVLNTNIDYSKYLQLTEMNRILQAVENQGQALSNLAEWVNAELAKSVNGRFQGLQTYFSKTETFNREKANADVGYAKGRLDKYMGQISTLLEQLTEDVKHILTLAFTAHGLELVEKMVHVAIQGLRQCNPFTLLQGGAIEDLMDRLADVVKTAGDLAELSQILGSLKKVVESAEEIGKKLQANQVFLGNVQVLMNSVLNNDNLFSNEFEKRKQRFLSKYGEWNPEADQPELTAMFTQFDNIINDACDVLVDTETSAGGTVSATARGLGYCPSAKIFAQTLLETYQEIYDFQFEYVEAMASTMKAMTALDASSYLVTDYEAIVKKSEQARGRVDDANILSLASLIAYKFNIWQIVEDYCDIVEYKQGGVRPDVCRGLETELSSLASYVPAPLCRDTEAYKEVPTSATSGSAFMNVTELYTGKRIEFQIPNKEWLVQNQWISQADAESAIFVKKFEIFLPSDSTHERMGRVEANVVGWNQLTPTQDSTSYVITPEKKFIFEFLEGNDVQCRQSSQIMANPYGSSYPKICPQNVDENNCLELLRKTALFPSIYSKWKVSIKGYETVTIPEEAKASEFKLKVGMKLCIQTPQTVDQETRGDKVTNDRKSVVLKKKDKHAGWRKEGKKIEKVVTIRGRRAGGG